MTWHRAAIALGSNLGNRAAHLDLAVAGLEAHPQVRVLRRSRTRETAPVGGPPQGPYLNGVVLVESRLALRDLFALLRRLEQEAGRVRRVRHGPRTLDLDLLWFDQEVREEPDLTVPHPRLPGRAFVLQPLAEVAPDWTHPLLGRTAADLWQSLQSPVP